MKISVIQASQFPDTLLTLLKEMSAQTTIIIQNGESNPYNAQAYPGQGQINPIEPRFNDSRPNQPPDYTAPQQPYYADSHPNKQTVDLPSNNGYAGTHRIVRSFHFLKTIPGVLNFVVLVSILSCFPKFYLIVFFII